MNLEEAIKLCIQADESYKSIDFNDCKHSCILFKKCGVVENNTVFCDIPDLLRKLGVDI